MSDRVGRTMIGRPLQDMPATHRDGALFYTPREAGNVRGGRPESVMPRGFHTRSRLNPPTTAAVVAGMGLAAASLLGGTRRR